MGESQFGRGDRHCGTLGIYVICGGASHGDSSHIVARVANQDGSVLELLDPDPCIQNMDPDLGDKSTIMKSI